MGSDDPLVFESLVLVLNDDPLQLDYYSLLLEEAGYQVVRFQNSEEALHFLHKTDFPPDLIITDLYMPCIDGWKMCRLLRSVEYERYHDVPILIISATFAGADVERISSDLGANAFLSAPVKKGQFLSTVKALLQGETVNNYQSVLVVDDSELLCEIVEGACKQHGYNVIQAGTVKTAWEKYSIHNPDVVIIDYLLPDGKGDELLEEFRTLQPHGVFIMMTSDPNPKLAVEWMYKGASAYIRKPFEPEYLVSLCNKAIRERKLLFVEELLEERSRELIENNELMGRILSTMEIGLIIHNPDRTVDWVNGYIRRSFSNGDPIGKVCYRFFEGRERPCEQCAVRECFRTGEISEVVSYNKKNHHWFHSIAHPLKDKEGNAAQVLETVVDITEQKQSAEFLKQVFEAIVHPFYVVQVDNYLVQMANSAAGPLSEGTTCYGLSHHADAPCNGADHPCPIEEIKRTGKPAVVIHHHYIDEVQRLFEVHAFPLFDEEGKLERVLEYSIDVTEREEAKNRQTKALREKEVLLKEIHHRVKNNLSVVTALLNLQSSEADNQELKNHFLDAIGRIESMALVHEKLYQSNDFSAVNIRSYIEEIVGQLIETFRSNESIIHCSFNVSESYIDLDTAVPLGLIINELVTNSLKYAFPDSHSGMITITLKAMEKNHRLRVEDNGKGIRDENRKASLGLTLVQALAEQIEGTFFITSDQNGTIGTLEFPM
ncbi:MAG: response regulator [Spirochaetales bacterium]|nr:response regulator [Spirochaetales bacterium]MCF7938165.1 response regulator [Spirochaetales bacterium]